MRPINEAGETILLLGNPTTTNMHVKGMLKREGHEVEIVPCFEDLHERSRELSPDVVLMETGRSNSLDDAEELVRLREVHDGPVLLLGEPDGDPPESVVQTGLDVDGFMADPLESEKVCQMVREVLNEGDQKRWEWFFDRLPAPAVQFDEEGRVVAANETSRRLWTDAALEGQSLRKIVPLDLERTNGTTRPTDTDVRVNGERYTFEYVPAQSGRGGFLIGRETTREYQFQDDLKKTKEEKQSLLQEIQDRVRNNLQIILSLINLQLGSNNEVARQDLLELRGRVHAIALVYKQLYGSRDPVNLNAARYLRQLAGDLFGGVDRSESSVDFEFNVDPLKLDTTVLISCGLILREIIEYMVQTAFRDGQIHRTITVSLRRDEPGKITFTLEDNGRPLSDRPSLSGNLGFRLAENLSDQQLDGDFNVEESEDGARFVVRFPTPG